MMHGPPFTTVCMPSKRQTAPPSLTQALPSRVHAYHFLTARARDPAVGFVHVQQGAWQKKRKGMRERERERGGKRCTFGSRCIAPDCRAHPHACLRQGDQQIGLLSLHSPNVSSWASVPALTWAISCEIATALRISASERCARHFRLYCAHEG